MARKLFIFLKARVQSKQVYISFYKSTSLYYESKGRQKEDTVVCIYRKSNPKFKFGEDYAEFFDGMNYKETDLIFKGNLAVINNRKYEFVDNDVKIGETYSYWVSSDKGDEPIGPVNVKIRDPEVWWPYNKCEEKMKYLVEKYPKILKINIFGKTSKGKLIKGIVAGNKKKCIALVGAIHAGESGPELILPALERIIKENKELLNKVGLAVLPSVNIDERERLVEGVPLYLRTNSNGVDINRNFDANWKKVEYGYGLVSSDPDSMTYRGSKPESEPETQAVVNFIKKTKPLAVFSYHALACITGARFLGSKGKNKESFIKKCEYIVNAYTQGMYSDKKRKIQLEFYETSGGFNHWVSLKYGVPCFDLEDDGREDAENSHIDKTTLQLLKKYQEYHYAGISAVLKKLESGI